MKTKCKDCVFAKFTNNIQTGCELARLERFAVHGGIEQKTEDGKTFFEINRFCTTCRHPECDWSRKTPEADRVRKVLNDIRLQHTFVYEYEPTTTIEQFNTFVDDCINQTHKLHTLIILNKTHKPVESKVYDKLEELEKHNIIWKLIWVMPNVESHLALNEIIGKIETPYFSVFHGDLTCRVASDFVHKIHVALNERLEMFIMLDDEGRGGLTVQTNLFYAMDGVTPVEVDLIHKKGYISNIETKVYDLLGVNNENHLAKLLSSL